MISDVNYFVLQLVEEHALLGNVEDSLDVREVWEDQYFGFDGG